MAGYDFECFYCGEEYDSSLQFEVHIINNDGSEEHSDEVCPDCVATWFTETPEDVFDMRIKRVNKEAL